MTRMKDDELNAIYNPIRALSGKEIAIIKARIKADYGDEISDALAAAIGQFALEMVQGAGRVEGK